jgi:hypothetical protein
MVAGESGELSLGHLADGDGSLTCLKYGRQTAKVIR